MLISEWSSASIRIDETTPVPPVTGDLRGIHQVGLAGEDVCNLAFIIAIRRCFGSHGNQVKPVSVFRVSRVSRQWNRTVSLYFRVYLPFFYISRRSEAGVIAAAHRGKDGGAESLGDRLIGFRFHCRIPLGMQFDRDLFRLGLLRV